MIKLAGRHFVRLLLKSRDQLAPYLSWKQKQKARLADMTEDDFISGPPTCGRPAIVLSSRLLYREGQIVRLSVAHRRSEFGETNERIES